MSKKTVKTSHAPAAIGPYSQAVTGAGLIFVSGQIPLVPGTGEISGTDIKEQTDRVMKNLDAVLTAGGSDLGRVLKTTIYLADMDDFPLVNDIYGSYFDSEPPARATVEVSRLPKGVLVEIDAVALAV